MKKLFIIGALFMLFGCSGTDPKVYASQKPEMDIRDFFNGKVEGFGFFKKRGGEIDTRYYVQMTGKFSETEGTLYEKFYEDDGATSERTWTLKFKDKHNFIGTAADIEGEAIGRMEGYAMNMKYTLNIKRKSGGTVSVNMDDWIYLQPNGDALNSVKMTKLGFHVGDVMFHFRQLKEGESFRGRY
jgi:hypothetical protein